MWGRLKKFNVSVRPRKVHSFDATFFDSIDTEEKAYCLGLLCADGAINPKSGTVELSLAEHDLDIVCQFKRAIGYTGGIRPRKRGGLNSQVQHRIALCSKSLCNSLAKAGCGPRKSHTLEFTKAVPRWLQRHFIRGYFDGDGGVSWLQPRPHYTRQCTISMISTRDFCDGMNEYIELALGFRGRIRQDKSCGMWYLTFTGNGRCRKVRDMMYVGSRIYGRRKHDALASIPSPCAKPGRQPGWHKGLTPVKRAS
jgi:hypothetical protein